MKRKIAILGATGSIGTSALDVIQQHPDDFSVVLLSACSNVDSLLDMSLAYPDAKLALASDTARKNDKIEYYGNEALIRAIQESNADIVLNGISGAAGLLPSLKALECGADLALANKESIVMAAPLLFSTADKHACRILPVDSEHSAVFNLIQAHGAEALEEIIITASGGPFRGFGIDALRSVSVHDALAHPTWKMGGKISIDSASLANKGLEVIEAVRLFKVPAEKVRVLVHPQSIVHSMIRLRDGSIYAQLSKPDMRLPIHNALFWPESVQSPFGAIDLAGQTLSFENPETNVFPMLPLAYTAARQGSFYPTAYNAANEIAVAEFIRGTCSFLEISKITEYVLHGDWTGDDTEIEAILEADKKARYAAERYIREFL